MKLAVIYSDKRGRYLADCFRNFCDVVEVNLSDVTFTSTQKILCAAVSFHFNRFDWVNDFHRNPLAVSFRKKNGNTAISRCSEKVDAVFQFGVMNPYDYSLLGAEAVFYYLDGAYDKYSKLWTIKRYKKWFPLMQKKAFEKASATFTFSQWAKQQIVTDYAQDVERVVTTGWGPCLPVENTDVPLRNGAHRLLFIGKAGKRKGLHILVSAFREVKKQYRDIVLDVVGVEAKDAPGLNTDGIFFHGRQAEQNVINFLQQADLFILPSLYERAGHVTVEAMWYGCPVIVTNTSGAPEPVLAGNCGLIVEPGNVHALQNAIVTMIEKSDNFQQLSRNAMYEARKNWSWNTVCEKMVNHMKSAIEVAL